MITRIVKMTFKEESISTFEKLFEQYKEEIASQPGCSKLQLLQDVNRPEIFMTYSWWNSEDDLDAYRHSDTFKLVWPATKVLFAAKPEAWSVHVHTDVA